MSIFFPYGPYVGTRKYQDSWMRGRSEATLRSIRGSINTGTPTITAGVGFTVVKNDNGDVTITFDLVFSSPPAVMAAAVDDQNTSPFTIWVRSRTASAIRIIRWRIGIGQTDGDLDFLAVGPTA